jgi:hypothetical protein
LLVIRRAAKKIDHAPSVSFDKELMKLARGVKALTSLEINHLSIGTELEA